MVKKKLKKKHLQVSTEYTNGQADGGRTPHDDVASRGKNTVCRLSQDHDMSRDLPSLTLRPRYALHYVGLFVLRAPSLYLKTKGSKVHTASNLVEIVFATSGLDYCNSRLIEAPSRCTQGHKLINVGKHYNRPCRPADRVSVGQFSKKMPASWVG